MGWLSRKAGLSIDNLVSAEVVVADGRILRASEEWNSDLFWAIRGGGGNFGVVTELEFRLHDVDPVVQYGLLFWDVAEGGQALRLMRDIIVDLPRSLTALPAVTTRPRRRLSRQTSANWLCGGFVGFRDGARHQKTSDMYVARCRHCLNTSLRCHTSLSSRYWTKPTHGVCTAMTRAGTSRT